VFNDFRNAANVRGDYWQSCCHRFHKDNSKRFFEGRQNKYVAAFQERLEVTLPP